MNFLKALFGGHEETAAECEQKKQDKHFDILKYDGVRAAQIGQADYAVRCFTEALKLKEDDETAHILAQVLLRINRPQEAYEVLDTLANKRPGNMEVLMAKGHAAYALERYDEVKALCAHVPVSDANGADALFLKAQAEHKNGEALYAVASVTQALTLRPEMEEAYHLRASILQELGQLEQAEADADYLLEHFTPSEETLLLKADLRTAQGKADEAIPYYNKVKAANPFNECAYTGLSHAYADTHRMELSLHTLAEGMEMLPQSAALYKERGRIQLALGNKEGALDDLKKALELNPNEGEQLQGQFTNITQEMEARYKSLNPYGF